MSRDPLLRHDVQRPRIRGKRLRAVDAAHDLAVQRPCQLGAIRAQPIVAQAGDRVGGPARAAVPERVQALMRFDHPRVERTEVSPVARCGKKRRLARTFRRSPKQRLQKPVRCRCGLEIQRHAQTGGFESAPQLVPLHRDAGAIDLDHETARRVRGIEPCLDAGVDLLEKAIDGPPPLGHQPALAQQRLRLILEACRVAARDRVAAGVGFDPDDCGHRLAQLKLRGVVGDRLQTVPPRQMFEQSPLVTLLGRKQRRPLLQLDEDECLDGGRQTREHFGVLLRDGGSVTDQPGIKLHALRPGHEVFRLHVTSSPRAAALRTPAS